MGLASVNMSILLAANRNFLRRTKATAPPDTTESDTATVDNVDTTTNKFTRRGGSKFKNRKDVLKEAANDTGRIEKNEFENRTRRPYFSSGPRRSERPAAALTPTRTFARRKPGGANVTTAAPQLSSTISPPSRRPFRVASRRRPIIGSTTTTTTTTTTTEATTTAIESGESLQDIGDTDFIEDPSLEPKTPKISPKIQRRPLVTLKEGVKDQNPSATNEEEGKRQSKKYSASIKQNQLDDLLRLKAKSQEDTTEYKTTVEEYSAETALAIAAHQLLIAPVPSIPDFEEETRPTRTQTTQEYKYTSPVTDYADSKFPYEYPTTTVYKPSTEQNYISTTVNDFDDPTQFNTPKFSTTTNEPIEFDSPKLTRTTYDVTQINSQLSTTTNEPTMFSSQLPRTTYDSTQFNSPILSTTTYEPTEFNSPKLPTTTYETTEFHSPKLPTTTYETTEFNSPKLPSTTYEPTVFNSPKLSRTYDSIQFNPRSSPTPFTPKTTYDSDITDTETATENSTPLTLRINKLSFGNELTFSTADYPTVNEYTNIPIEYNSVTPSPTSLSPKSSVSKESRFPDFTYDNDNIRTTDYAPRISPKGSSEPSPFSRVPVSVTDYTNLPTDYLPKLSQTTNYARKPPSTFKTRQGFSTANVITSGLSGVSKNLGSRYQTSEKYIPVPVEGLEYSSIGYPSSTQEPISRSQEPSYFTREYLLESPVTKTYDDEYQYLAPVTTPQTPPRRIIRKKIQRKISTTIRPTTTFRPRLTTAYIPLTTPYIAPVTTPKPRRVPSKKPFEKILKEDPPRTYRPIVNYDYYDDSEEKVAEKYVEGTKVVLHTKGAIECLDIGNFPHPTSCKKFISCARMESGALLGWEYICPKGLSFDPVGSICNWSAGLGCDEKDI